MHLLAATPGRIDDDEPVDLNQSPADLVVLSAADTELAALSHARAAMEDAPSLRLAQLSNLQHPMSVDLHLDNTATKSRLVVARILGGAAYWKYGFEQYAARLREAGDHATAAVRAAGNAARAETDILNRRLGVQSPATAPVSAPVQSAIARSRRALCRPAR